MNEADLADIEVEQHLQASLASRIKSPSKPVLRCIKCEGRNDRAEQDYAVCSDCVAKTLP